ncbi:MAG: hypothetical protein JXA71_01260 [Chitinispirillaceae bacterium]|nr:hypothetical protein [Chitinispirillaceae bacterium]
MTESWMAIVSALWLGILTSISPCPLASNIAAVSYVGRRVGSTRMVLLSGLLYTIGRTLVYITLGIMIAKGLLTIPGISNFLQHYMNKIVGPMCIVVGLLLFGFVRMPSGGGGISKRVQQNIDTMGIWGAGVLGILFALAFCPASAGLFFGGLVSIAIKNGSTVVIPAVYGIGTAVPVIIFAVVPAFAANMVGKIFNTLSIIDAWARRLTAVLFLLIGAYLILTHWLGIYLFF